ncbi:hypothetical protein [Pantoea ananatis]|uniref:hypothetical protein n=1 Tax=Pantoea ananas TaxID=553 RepID=UPI000CF3E560|nr:hypothetical protein [Pantoea ananatis]PQL08968.1 hypothetical protein CG436_03570 [Pantoea ananatis]
MAIEDEVLKRLFERGVFEGKHPAQGISSYGIDHGYESLTEAQKSVINPLMTLPCDGVEDPGGYHNECTNQLADAELVQAIDDEGYYDGLLCPDCRSNHFDWYESSQG